MRNKPLKLFILLNGDNEPFRVGGVVKTYGSAGKAIKKAKAIYTSRATPFSVVRAGLVHKAAE